MKKLLFITLMMLYVGTLSSQEKQKVVYRNVNFKKCSKNKAVYISTYFYTDYKKDIGKVVTKNTLGQIVKEKSGVGIRRGIKDGYIKEYYATGDVSYEIEYRNGKWVAHKVKGLSIDEFLTLVKPAKDDSAYVDENSTLLDDREATFWGGPTLLNKYLQEREYPYTAQENGIQGYVKLEVTITKDGSLGNIKIIRGVDPSLDKAAKQHIMSMPKWVPAVKDNKFIDQEVSITIRYDL